MNISKLREMEKAARNAPFGSRADLEYGVALRNSAVAMMDELDRMRATYAVCERLRTRPNLTAFDAFDLINEIRATLAPKDPRP